MSYEVDSRKTILITEDIFKMLPVVRTVSLLVIVITVSYIYFGLVIEMLWFLWKRPISPCMHFIHFFIHLARWCFVFFKPSSAVVEASTGYHRSQIAGRVATEHKQCLAWQPAEFRSKYSDNVCLAFIIPIFISIWKNISYSSYAHAISSAGWGMQFMKAVLVVKLIQNSTEQSNFSWKGPTMIT